MGYSGLGADLSTVMQTATIALVCVLSAGAVAVAAEQAPPPQTLEAPQPPAGHPPYPPAPPPSGQGGLALPDLGGHETPEHEEPASKPAPGGQPPAHPQDQGAMRARTDATARRNEPPRGRTCFSQSETREKIVTHRLSDPFRAFRSGHIQGDALRARLCRWRTDEFVYEISVLRRDGRIAHVYMDATTGQAVAPPNDGDRK